VFLVISSVYKAMIILVWARYLSDTQ